MTKALARLRARTDRELSILAEKKIEQTLVLVEAGRFEEAAETYQAAKRLLVVTNLAAAYRERIENQLARAERALQIEEPFTAVA
jgi:hypothetical protein